jgi:predicted house-cleaning noncanonical NTP pyrophosphatase (MazG superfamily)
MSKIIRDKIPGLLDDSARVRKVSYEEALPLMRDKVVEETSELLEALDSVDPNTVMPIFNELADVIEATFGLCRLHRPLEFDVYLDNLISTVKVKREMKGSFTDYFLLEGSE